MRINSKLHSESRRYQKKRAQNSINTTKQKQLNLANGARPAKFRREKVCAHYRYAIQLSWVEPEREKVFFNSYLCSFFGVV